MFIAIAMICFTLLYIVNGEKVEEIRPRGGKGRRGGRGRRVFKGKKYKLPSYPLGKLSRKSGKGGKKGGANPPKPPAGGNADDTFLADQVEKYDCDAKQIGKIFTEAKKKKIKISLAEIQNEFKGCQKLKAEEDTESDDPDQDEEGSNVPCCV